MRTIGNNVRTALEDGWFVEKVMETNVRILSFLSRFVSKCEL